MDDLLFASPPQPRSTAALLPLVSDTATLPETLPLLECVTLALDVAVAWIAFSDGAQPCYVATIDPVAVAGLLSDETLMALAKDSDALVVVEDAAQDSRLLASPWVTEPVGICFFASVPILLGHQQRAGTLCVADRTAHSFDANQVRKLVALAATATKIIEGFQAVQRGNTLQLELQRTKTLLERTGSMAGVGGWEVDLVANTVFWSDETCRIHGVAPGYLPQLSEAIEFYAPQARPVVEAAVTQAIATGERWDLELPFIQKDGTEIWVHALGVVEFEQGKPVRLVGAFQDITARRLAEAALVISESQFRGSFEAASHGIALVSVHGNFLKVNQSLCKMLGYSEAELLVADFQTITHPDDLALDLHHVEELLQGVVETYEMAKRYFHKGGRTIWAQLNVSLVRKLDGTPVHFVSQIQDITDRKNLTARLQTLLDTASDGIHILDSEGNVLQFSQSFTLLLGYTEEETARLNIRDWDAMFETQELIPEIGRLIAQPRAFETQYRRKDGIILNVEVYAKGVVLDGVERLYASARDITARRQAEWALEQGRLLTKDILDSVSSEIAVLNESGDIVATNDAWRRFAAENDGSLDSASSDNVDVGANYLNALSTLPSEPTDSVNIREGIESVINGKLPKFSCEYPCHSPEKQRWFVMTVTPMHTGDRGAVIVRTDITARKEAETLLYDYAFHDSLTKLANRRLLQERLNMTVASNKRSGTYGALLVIDLDNFKPLNDQYGHAVGDLLLKEVANRLTSSVRQFDTVARIGGDEFVIALGALSDSALMSRQLATRIAEKVRTRLAEPYAFTVHQGLGEIAVTHRCTASIGGALFSPSGVDQMETFRQADAAMYLAKESGRNSVRFEDER
jgi:diguanylate cyclase (GGDEF)-like protein/PAS domain S-box-containing protein